MNHRQKAPHRGPSDQAERVPTAPQGSRHHPGAVFKSDRKERVEIQLQLADAVRVLKDKLQAECHQSSRRFSARVMLFKVCNIVACFNLLHRSADSPSAAKGGVHKPTSKTIWYYLFLEKLENPKIIKLVCTFSFYLLLFYKLLLSENDSNSYTVFNGKHMRCAFPFLLNVLFLHLPSSY